MGTIGNINLRVGTDLSELTASMKLAQNTIANFKNESMASLKSFGLPHLSTTNLTESILSGQRTIVNFSRESSESLAQFQTRVRAVFEEVGIDISGYEKLLENAGSIHADFAKGALRNFSAVADAGKESTGKMAQAFEEFKGKISSAFQTMGDSGTGFGEKIFAAGNLATTVFPELMAAVMAVEFVKRIAEWTAEIEKFAEEVEDVQHRFIASTGLMSDQATEFSENLAKNLGVSLTKIKDEMGKEYTNTRFLGFDPQQSEEMSENLVKLSFDLGKLRGEDPSAAFDKLKSGVEGQTKGLSELGIRITNADIQQKALSEGVIKHGQVLTDQQKSMVIYKELMEKTAGVQGYYATTTNDLSTQSTKLSAGWEEIKDKLANALTPAFTEFLKVVNLAASGVEWLIEELATGVQYITLFVEDVASAVQDVGSLDFSHIGEQWANNSESIFNSSNAAKQFGASLDTATTAANEQDAAQQKLGKSLQANVMSFDQLHNITKDTGGDGGSGGGMPGVMAGEGIKPPSFPGGGSDDDKKNKGLFIPIAWGPIPPFQNLPVPPAVQVLINALDSVSPFLATIKTKIGELPKLINIPVSLIGEAVLLTALEAIGSKVAEWKADAIRCFDAVGNTVSGWKTSAVKAFDDIKNKIDGWQTDAVTAFGVFSTALASGFNKGFSAATETIRGWQVAASEDFSTFKNNAVNSITAFGTQFENAWSTTLGATESMVGGWATTVKEGFTSTIKTALSDISSLASAAGKVLTNIGDSIGNWAKDHKELLGAAGTGIVVGGATIATGGLDLIPAGVAAAGAGLASVGAGIASMAIPSISIASGLASGGIVTMPSIRPLAENEPEAVIPLSQIDSVLGNRPNTSNGGNNGSQNQQIIINLTNKMDGRTLSRAMYSHNVNEVDRQGKIIGYNPAYNYPR